MASYAAAEVGGKEEEPSLERGPSAESMIVEAGDCPKDNNQKIDAEEVKIQLTCFIT